MEKLYRIGIIVTWFGELPPYFPVWLKSAEANRDIDFLIFCDRNIESKSENIKTYLVTMEHILRMFEKKLRRNITFTNSYKFCDSRAFFGITFEEYLKEYDFWGYCDIDLVFGRIRNFITNHLLRKIDRFYQYGHLSIFRNTEKINRLYDLPGGIYTYNEIFCGTAKTTPEEHFGINRICEKNHIKWYTNADFADFAIKYPERLEVKHGLVNYDKQIFVWEDGIAYRLYEQDGVQKKEEFIYMHWQKRKPVIEGEITNQSFFILTGNKILSMDHKKILEHPKYEKWNPTLSKNDRKHYKKMYFIKKIKEFKKQTLRICSNFQINLIFRI